MAVRNAVGVAIALAVGLMVNNHLIALGLSIGALMSSFSDSALPYRRRAEHLLAASACVAAMIFVGTQTAKIWPVATAITAMVGFASALAVCLGQEAGDIGLAAIVTITIFSARSVTWDAACTLALSGLFGGLIQTACSLLMMPFHPYAPQRQMLAAYFSDLADWIKPTADGRRTLAENSIPQSPPSIDNPAALDDDFSIQGQRIRSLVTQGERVAIQLLRLREIINGLPTEAAQCKSLLDVQDVIHQQLMGVVKILTDNRRTTNRAPMPAGIYMFDQENIAHDMGCCGAVDRIDDLTECLAILARQLWIIADIAADAMTARSGRCDPSRPEVRYNRRLTASFALIGVNLNFHSPAFRHAIRMAACLIAGMFAAHMLRTANGYWIPMTVGLVLKPDFSATISRGLLRIAGTMIGLILLTWLYALAPAFIGIPIVLVGILMLLLRYFGPMNYGLFAVFISGLIVILLAQGGEQITHLINARALCTLIGGGIAVMAYCLWPTREQRQVGRHVESLLRTHQQYLLSVLHRFDDTLPKTESPPLSRRKAQLARVNLEASISRLMGEMSADPQTIRLLSGIMASSLRLFNAAAALESMDVTAPRHKLITCCRPFFTSLDLFLIHLSRAETTPAPMEMTTLLRTFQSIPLPTELLQDSIRLEIVHLINSVNTLGEQIIAWRGSTVGELKSPVPPAHSSGQ